MLIGGIQKLSLLDYPDKMCCTVFTMGCNYRCPFCHNASLIGGMVPEQNPSQEEVIDFLKKRKGLLDGVCITGGEPLLQNGLENFLYRIKSFGFSVKLDTNGSFPERLAKLIEEDLIDYVAMDIKNSPERYGMTVGIEAYDIAPVKESIDLLLSCIVPYEFRTTVVREFHAKEDILSIAHWIKGAGHYYLQSFKDSEDVLKRGLSGYSKEDMQFLRESILHIVPSVKLRGI